MCSLCMLSVRVTVNNRLLTFWGSQKLNGEFLLHNGSASLTPMSFKGQLFGLHFLGITLGAVWMEEGQWGIKSTQRDQ